MTWTSSSLRMGSERTLYFWRRSLHKGALISFRLTLDGAVKCALRLLRREELTFLLYFILLNLSKMVDGREEDYPRIPCEDNLDSVSFSWLDEARSMLWCIHWSLNLTGLGNCHVFSRIDQTFAWFWPTEYGWPWLQRSWRRSQPSQTKIRILESAIK